MSGINWDSLPSSIDKQVARHIFLLAMVCMAVFYIYVTAVLLNWILPPKAQFLSASWMQMQSNTALALLLAGLLVPTFRIAHNTYRIFAKTGLFVLVVMILLNSLLILYTDREVNALNNFLVNSRNQFNVFPISVQSIIAIAILAITPLFNVKNSHMASVFHDGLVSVSFTIITFYAAAHIYQATDFFAVDENILLSNYTLFALLLLTIMNQVSKCTPGLYSIFLKSGTGGENCRHFVFPVVFILFFIMSIIHNQITRGSLDITEAFSVITAMVLSGVALLLIYLSYDIDKYEWQLREQATKDELTQLLNRRGFNLLADQVIKEARRKNERISILFFDLDNLKIINDRYGHKTGSELIATFARCMKSAFRESDVIARIGGDEFIVLIRDPMESVERIIGRLRDHMSNLTDPTTMPDFSYGEAEIFPTTVKPLEDIIKQADERMYEAKKKKKVSEGTQ